MAEAGRKKVIEREQKGASPVGNVEASEPFPGFGDFDEQSEIQVGSSKFSLDDFELEAPKPVTMPEEKHAPAEEGGAPGEPARKGLPNARKSRGNRRFIAIAAGALVVVAAVVAAFSMMSGEEPEKPIVSLIRRSIEVPVMREKMEFILVSRAREERGMVSMTIELEFHNPERLRKFREDGVLYRDMAYRFLDAQRPSKNSLKAWQPIVQKDLQAFLKEKLPQAAADSLRMERLERL